MKRMMIKASLMMALFAAAPLTMNADVPKEVEVSNPMMTRNGSFMTVDLGLEFSKLDLKSNQAAVFTPMIAGETDTLTLPAVAVYGRTRWYQYERNGMKPFDGNTELALRYKKDMAPVEYRQIVDFQDWMNVSDLILRRSDYGCAGCGEGVRVEDIAQYRYVPFTPVFLAQEVVAAEEKTRELSGRAYVDFPVNITVIYPDYRRNAIELAKIIGTIDSVKNDKDITVTALSIKGFASPEGPYDNNVRLAKGRTEALKVYVQNLYHFAPDFISTSYEPEDWEGLREFVVNSNIPNRDGILEIIDSDLAPDPKNTKIQTTYPEQYKFLLAQVYPGLRHSDYKIEYKIRQFNDIAEIAEILRTEPSKLSLNEIYRLAMTYEPGTPEYNNIFETAAVLFPDNEAANLNAANAAMQRGDLIGAEKYLLKAGNSGKANYARGILAALKADYDAALNFMQMAQSAGIPEAAPMVEHLQKVKVYAPSTVNYNPNMN